MVRKLGLIFMISMLVVVLTSASRSPGRESGAPCPRLVVKIMDNARAYHRVSMNKRVSSNDPWETVQCSQFVFVLEPGRWSAEVAFFGEMICQGRCEGRFFMGDAPCVNVCREEVLSSGTFERALEPISVERIFSLRCSLRSCFYVLGFQVRQPGHGSIVLDDTSMSIHLHRLG